jgi:hypothetical protein
MRPAAAALRARAAHLAPQAPPPPAAMRPAADAPRARAALLAPLVLLLLAARGAAAAALSTQGSKILMPDGTTQYFGRGVNVMDTRGCAACVAEQSVEEVVRRIDFAVTTM